MVGREAIWHVIVDDVEQGPLTKAQVLEYLRRGTLAGNDQIWRPGLPDWKSVSEISDFWQPPQRTAQAPVQSQTTVQSTPDHVRQPEGIYASSAGENGEKWSLWKSANIGLLVGAFTLLLQIGGGRGLELANYAHTASAATVSGPIGQILAAPLIFVLVAVVRNSLNRHRRQLKSSASAAWGPLTFAGLLVAILGALIVYGEIFFSSTEAISGETRKTFVGRVYRACAQKQKSLGQNITEDQIEKYCACTSEKMADGMTYKQLGTEPDASALAGLRQRAEAAGRVCS